MNEAIELKKGKSYFTFTGKLKISASSFNIGTTTTSGWNYSRVSIGVVINEHNTVYAELSGGHYENGDLIKRVWKLDDNNNKVKDLNAPAIHINWNDRFNKEILEQVSPDEFNVMSIDLDAKGNPVPQKFLATQDMVEAFHDFCTNTPAEKLAEIVVTVKGHIEFGYYNGSTTRKCIVDEIRRITDPNVAFKSTFKQTLYTNISMVKKNEIDTENALCPIEVYVPEYIGKYQGTAIKATYPLLYRMYLDLNSDRMKALIKALAMPKYNVNGSYIMMTVDGEFVEHGESTEVNYELLRPNTKEALELGFITQADVEVTAAQGNKRLTYMCIQKISMKKEQTKDDQSAESGICVEFVPNVYSQQDMENMINEFGKKISAAETGVSSAEAITPITKDDDIPFDTASTEATSTVDDLVGLLSTL